MADVQTVYQGNDELPFGDSELFEITGSVKWFDITKGYGFITSINGLGDVLLHVTALRASGIESIREGDLMRCQVLKRPKGMQVFKVLSVDAAATGKENPCKGRYVQVTVRPESDWEPAEVKWFNRVRGFGFLSADDGKADLFIHMETLRRCDFTELRPRQCVLVRWGHGPKGRTVAEIKPYSEV